MKKLYFLLILFAPAISFAQWTTSGANVYKSTGNVGIGLTNPSYPLSISANENQTTLGSNTKSVIRLSNGYGNAFGRRFEIQFGLTQLANEQLAVIASEYTTWANGFVGGDLVFGTKQNNATTMFERMRIKWDGNIGIGTSTPTSRLDVSDANSNLAILKLRNTAWACNQRTAIEFWNGGNKSYPTSRIVSQMDGCGADGEALLFETQTAGSTASSTKLIIKNNGSVGIGTTTPGSYKLAVAGKIAATGEVKVFVDGTTTFPDYVFDPSYKLPTLEETEKYVKENHHLPEVPTAAEIAKDGMSLNEMNVILLKKVEELTLYMIEMKKENTEMKKEIKELKENQKK